MVEKVTNCKLKIISLYRSNYSAQYHVREIAKLIKKNHTTLLPHIKDLEKDKFLISKTVGKNKFYSLNLNNILTKEYIALTEKFEAIKYLEKNFLIKRIYSEIFRLKLEGTIILFGSYAKKTQTKESDIDIFYLGKINKNDEKNIKKIGKIYGKTINIKKAILKHFEQGLKTRNTLIKETIKYHLILQSPDNFINLLWEHFNDIK